MKALKLLLLQFSLLSITVKVSFTSRKFPSAARFLVILAILQGKRLEGSVIESQRVHSRKLCAMECSKKRTCRSYNFCGLRKCQLNSEDVYSTLSGDDLITNDPNCLYVEMRKDFWPSCEEKGQKVR